MFVSAARAQLEQNPPVRFPHGAFLHWPRISLYSSGICGAGKILDTSLEGPYKCAHFDAHNMSQLLIIWQLWAKN